MVRWFLGEVGWISKKIHKENYWSYLFNFYRFFEIERILNSRPLTALFDNDNE